MLCDVVSGKGSGTYYSAAPLTCTQDQKCFTVSEVAAIGMSQ